MRVTRFLFICCVQEGKENLTDTNNSVIPSSLVS